MNKIDFAVVISAAFCNPNGDPLSGNRPRQDFGGKGYITDVCLKRKIRNRWQDLGANILIVPDDRVTDGRYSIKSRVDSQESLKNNQDYDSFYKEACKIWLDVRAFGQVFAFKGKKGEGVSLGIRGPVSIGAARSLDIIELVDYSITKSTNLEESSHKKDSSTMAVKYFVQKAAYVAYGSISPQLAEKTKFSEQDVLMLKEALSTLLENDMSAARPSGSMESKLYWWEHSSQIGNARPKTVFDSLHIQPQEEWPYFSCFPEELPGIELSII